MLLVQLLLVIATAKLVGTLARRIGQPQVVGEMLAGFILGPALFGHYFPEIQHSIFAAHRLEPLRAISELGLVLFAFIIGAEIRLPSNNKPAAWPMLGLSLGAIVTPFFVGAAYAPWLHAQHAPTGTSLSAFLVFIGAVYSVTAFPVLARILKELGLLHSVAGAKALLVAAMSDVVVWVLLAVVSLLQNTESSGLQVLARLAGLGVLVFVSGRWVRPALATYWRRAREHGQANLMAVLLGGVLAYGICTHVLQVHALFGAFMFGLCLPRDSHLLELLVERIEHLTLTIFMPCFFALSGLSTNTDALSLQNLPMMLTIIALAIFGKVAGGLIVGRTSGQSWHGSWSTGFMINTRGLMELVVLKIGLDIGLIDATLYTTMIVMTIVTTLMTAPALSLLKRLEDKSDPAPQGRNVLQN